MKFVAMTPATSHDRQQEQAFPPLSLHIATRRRSYGRNFQAGDKIEAEDSQKKWYPARIVQVDEEDSCVLIHFDGFNARYDEWIEMASPRLRIPARRGRDKTALTHLRIGESVLARWTDGKFYPARIAEISDESYRVQFYDGYSRTLSPNNIRPSDTSSRAHSRSGSGRSSGDGVNTPTSDGRESRRSRSRSRKSSAVSSSSTTPRDSPHSPAENGGPHTSNGHTHADANRAALELVKTTLESCKPDKFDVNGLYPHCEEVVRRCVMSAVPRVDIKQAKKRDTVTEDISSKPHVNGVGNGNGNHSHQSPNTSAEPSAAPKQQQPSPPSTSSSPAPGCGHNGFHDLAGSTRTPPTSMPPCVGSVYPDEFTSPIVTPSLPEFTPLSPGSSPNHPPVLSGDLPASVVSPLVATRPVIASLCAEAPCSIEDRVAVQSPPVGVASIHTEAPCLPVCKTGLQRRSEGTHTPTSQTSSTAFTPTGSPVKLATSPSPRPSMSQSEASTATPEVSQVAASEARHLEAAAPPVQATCPVSVTSVAIADTPNSTITEGVNASAGVGQRQRSDSESHGPGRPKRKKVDGVLAPPPSRIAPKEVIAVPDHNPFKCRVCEKSFRKFPLLEAHYKNYHPDKTREFSQSKKDYEKQSGAAATTPSPTEPVVKPSQPRKRGGPSKSSSVSALSSTSGDAPPPPPPPPPSRQRTLSGSSRRKEQDGASQTQLTSIAPAVAPAATSVTTTVAALQPAAVPPDMTLILSLALAPDVQSTPAPPPVSSLPSAPTPSDDPPVTIPPSRTKRKAVGPDGLPPKRGRPPLSLSTESTPRLPGALAKQRNQSDTSHVRSDSASSRKTSPLEAPPVRIPKSRRSLSFSSSDDSKLDGSSTVFDLESPKVKTDAGFIGLPADAVMCCSCRHEYVHAVLVKCSSCWTYQHLMCVPTLAAQRPLSKYQCRSCTHPSGKRWGGRDKLPSDWFNPNSVCRNPALLISSLKPSPCPPDMQPLLSAAASSCNSSNEPVAVPPAVSQCDEAEMRCSSKFVELQQATSQDIVAVGEVLAATSKQLRVLMQPDQPPNDSALNHLVALRGKPDLALLSPIRIRTEAIGSGHRTSSSASTPISTPSRDALVPRSGSYLPPVNAADVMSLHLGQAPSSPGSGIMRPAVDMPQHGSGGSSTPSPSVLLGKGDLLSPSLSATSLHSVLDGAGMSYATPMTASLAMGLSISPAANASQPQSLSSSAVASQPDSPSPSAHAGLGSPMSVTVAARAAGRSSGGSLQSPTATAKATSAGVKSKTNVAAESEQDANLRMQTAHSELLRRVCDVHTSVGSRLGHLEKIVSELEAIDLAYRDRVPISAARKRHQLAMFEELQLGLDELQHRRKL